ncbi:hypothetical protein AHAS_Ahas11G0164700 [Arachis hypogaea]
MIDLLVPVLCLRGGMYLAERELSNYKYIKQNNDVTLCALEMGSNHIKNLQESEIFNYLLMTCSSTKYLSKLKNVLLVLHFLLRISMRRKNHYLLKRFIANLIVLLMFGFLRYMLCISERHNSSYDKFCQTE